MRILLVEDDGAIADGLIYSLEREGFCAVHCADACSALRALNAQAFDLLLLDVGLPDKNGYELCRHAKSRSDTPVIFLTARDDEGSVVMGLDMGADDYITKPFRLRELISRIHCVLRRTGRAAETVFTLPGGVRVDTARAAVTRASETVLLTALEYRLLLTFLAHPGQVLSRTQLLSGIWDEAGSFVNDNTLTVYIKRLREKLETPGGPAVIETVRGLGYRLEGTI